MLPTLLLLLPRNRVGGGDRTFELFPDGCQVKVIPGTGPGIHGKGMEPYLGKVVGKLEGGRYLVKRFGIRTKGKAELAASLTRHATFESTALSAGKVRWRGLSTKQKERFEDTAPESLKAENKKLVKGLQGCRGASLRAMQAGRVRRQRALKKLQSQHEIALRETERRHQLGRGAWVLVGGRKFP